MSTDKKNIILILLVVLDLVFAVIVFKPFNKSTNHEATNKSKNTANNVVIEEKVEEEVIPVVFDNLTMEELVIKLNNTLKDDLSGKGELIASYALELNVDPYLVTAIMMHETGCEWGCSYVTKACNNVGGQVGYGCGGYQYFDTLDDGIRAMIYNVYSNYYQYGLTTAELMNPKYAESPAWANNVNNYINKIKNN